MNLMMPVAAWGGKLTSVSLRSSSVSASNSNTLVLPSNLMAGDLIVLWDRALNNSSGQPSLVIPSEFTQISTQTGTVGTSFGGRASASYKIANGTEAAQALTMQSGSRAQMSIAAVFKGDRPISRAELQNVTAPGLVNAQNPSAQSILAGAGIAPILAVAGYTAYTGVSGTTVTRGFNPAGDGEILGTVSSENTHTLRFKSFNLSPANISATLTLSSTIATLCGMSTFYFNLS